MPKCVVTLLRGLVLSTALLPLLPAQQTATAVTSQAAALLKDAKVQSALQFLQRNEPKLIEEQVRLSEIPAPPFQETKRALAYKKRFEELGLKNVRIDKVGNVLGERPGRLARPHLVYSAHLDTVHPPETDVRVKREGTILRGPGIADDARGLAVLLGVVEAMNQAGIVTEGPITFVGTVGEEGLGDLRGVKHLFEEELKGRIDRFLSIDGTGLTITNTGVGSFRYRVKYFGPGGHSFGSFGVANPIHAVGRLIAKIADFEVPARPKVTFNVGRINGGTSVNTISPSATAEIDMRSVDIKELKAIDEKFRNAVKLALSEENERWKNRGKLDVQLEMVGNRPGGTTAAAHPVTRSVIAVTQALVPPVSEQDDQATLREGSTDANIGMSLGVPSITIGGGGRSQGAHSPGEYFDSTGSHVGTQRALLVAIAMASDWK
jgi:tripeptide aminopeptidase